MSARVRVFIACSLDGFIAGPNDDLSWLPPPRGSGDDHGYGAFFAEVGALLMGRSTYEVAASLRGRVALRGSTGARRHDATARAEGRDGAPGAR
ncbi:MAG: hypothetical protein M5U28_24230 [Sandaracinaceae bacterium]|nr:hypothetical protein [Sandaracinaceae bacterium]